MKRVLLVTTTPIIVVIIIIYSIFVSREPTHDIGRVQAKGLTSVYFDLEQENEFDMATSIYYGISTENMETIVPMRYLYGTHDYITSPENFSANSVDSIIYLTWGDTTEIYAIYDLKTGKGYPGIIGPWKKSILVADSLFRELKLKKPYLQENWKKQ